MKRRHSFDLAFDFRQFTHGISI